MLATPPWKEPYAGAFGKAAVKTCKDTVQLQPKHTQVVVDTFAEYRQRDVIHLAEDLEVDLANDQKILQRMFERIDEDGSGLVSYEELVEGARKDPEFQSRLRVMDIDESDLRQLFDMIDSTGEGEIESSEFIAALSRWVHDSKTAPRFVKYNVLRSLQMQEELYETVHEQFEMLSFRLDPWFCYKRNLLNPLVISCHVVEIWQGRCCTLLFAQLFSVKIVAAEKGN